MKKTLIPLVLLLYISQLSSAQSAGQTQQSGKATQAKKGKTNGKNIKMLSAVNNFLQTLSAEQRQKASYSFDDEERLNWHFIPRERKGFPIKEMDENQRKAAMALLQTALSEKGYAKAKAIMEMEAVLKKLENRPPEDTHRDPEKYYFTVFGIPSDKEVWGWRMEGHHLSLNFSSATGQVVALTPAFMGSNPAIVLDGPQKGKQILKKEADLGFALVKSFTPEQLKKALIAEVAPNDIVTGSDRKAILQNIEGIHYTQMDANQQKLLKELLELYLQNYEKSLADDLRKKVEKSGMDQMHFAWAGSLEQEVGKAHYYRIHNPIILIEYDNSQNNANHVHTVIRDLTNDFGEDALREHYLQHKHGKAEK